MRRRDLLSAAAAALAPLPAALSDPASDPVLALAERHRIALAAYLEAAKVRRAVHGAFDVEHALDFPLPVDAHHPLRKAHDAAFKARVEPFAGAQQRAYDIEDALAREIRQTRATTLAGVIAKIEGALSRDDDWHDHDGARELDQVGESILADLRALQASA